MSKIKKTIAVILLIAVLLALILLPAYVDDLIAYSSPTERRAAGSETFKGIITVWHVVRFKPYRGSVGNWLKRIASKLEKRHFGVYLSVDSMSEERAGERIANGEQPDIISFPAGAFNHSALKPLDPSLIDITADRFGSVTEKALPYAASCRLLLTRAGKPEDVKAEAEAAKTASLEAFKLGRADRCIADARITGDLIRASDSGKTAPFDVYAFEESTELVQFIGITETAADAKLAYAYEFISLMLSDTMQRELCSLGLFPLFLDGGLEYEERFLQDAYDMLKKDIIWQHIRENDPANGN
ncbi:MAG: hypothetical protein IJM18_00520 [Clostridia bacterium]|nr:hypothetical protein [Clostridia bacterium]